MLNFICLSYLFVFSIFLYPSYAGADPAIITDLEYIDYTVIPLQSLTAILPVIPASLNRLPETLIPFLKPSKFVREIILVCPESITTRVRQMLQRTFASVGTPDHPDVSLHPWIGHLDPAIAVLRAISEVSTVWVLLMDDQGLSNVVDAMRSLLLHPPQCPVPFGPIGVLRSNPAPNLTPPFRRARIATYLQPPFVMPVSLGTLPINIQHSGINPWVNLGFQVSKHRLDAVGGIIGSDNKLTYFAANKPAPTNESLFPWSIKTEPWLLASPSLETSEKRGTFVFFFLLLDDLRNAAKLICKMKTKGENNIRILVYGEHVQTKVNIDWVIGLLEMERCTLIYDVLTTGFALPFSGTGSDILSKWFDTFDDPPDIIVARKELDPLVGYLLSKYQDVLLWDATLIQIPRHDLKYMEWMSSLSLIEWKSVANSIFSFSL